jgi:hypothetical protein
MLCVSLFDSLVLGWIALALLLVPFQLRLVAPYGRHVREGWGPRISNRLGWMLMESVSLVVFATLFLAGPSAKPAATWVFFAAWVAHYTHRSLIFPWVTHTKGKTIPLAIVTSAVCFNSVNAGLNGYYLGHHTASYSASWLGDPRFIAGVAIFIAGAAINVWADYRLIALRSNDDSERYVIPRSGLFETVSCPNHFGEVVEWSGFALMCWNLPALSFAVWTAANLIPRALAHHRWYRERFADYPRERRAVIPYLL